MLKKIITQDGSYSLYDSNLNETYHSKKGALTESLHVYISEGLDYWIKENPISESCKIFEMGFGTGLNAVLSKRFSETNKIKVIYSSIEKSPLSFKEIKKVKPKDLSENEDQIFNTSWNEVLQISPFFKIHKIHDDFFNVTYKHSFDIIFYDAFAYHAQPIMWSENALRISIDLLKKNGVWVSYCAKGEVRRIIQRLGLLVQRIPGPPGKREMLRAIKN